MTTTTKEVTKFLLASKVRTPSKGKSRKRLHPRPGRKAKPTSRPRTLQPRRDWTKTHLKHSKRTQLSRFCRIIIRHQRKSRIEIFRKKSQCKLKPRSNHLGRRSQCSTLKRAALSLLSLKTLSLIKKFTELRHKLTARMYRFYQLIKLSLLRKR